MIARATPEPPEPSKTQQRIAAVADLADRIEAAALAAGWRGPRRVVCTGGRSVYLRVRFGHSQANRRACFRISDHCPGKMIGGDGEPMFICIVGALGSYQNAERWLIRKAEEHRETARVNDAASQRTPLIMSALRERPGLTLHDLARVAGYDVAEVDALVAWLAERELVEVRHCPARQVYPLTGAVV